MRREYIAWFDMPNNGKLHGQSVMPQQEVIRCKDCRYFSKGTIKGKHVCMYFKNRVVIEASEDGFCSRAEKKDEHSTDERLTLQDISERIVDSITGAERKEK